MSQPGGALVALAALALVLMDWLWHHWTGLCNYVWCTHRNSIWNMKLYMKVCYFMFAHKRCSLCLMELLQFLTAVWAVWGCWSSENWSFGEDKVLRGIKCGQVRRFRTQISKGWVYGSGVKSYQLFFEFSSSGISRLWNLDVALACASHTKVLVLDSLRLDFTLLLQSPAQMGPILLQLSRSQVCPGLQWFKLKSVNLWSEICRRILGVLS